MRARSEGEKRGSGGSRIYGRVRGRMLTALVAGTHGVRYLREPLHRTAACGGAPGASGAALGTLACLLLVLLVLLFPLPSSDAGAAASAALVFPLP